MSKTTTDVAKNTGLIDAHQKELY
jgi:hypothetical protein